MSDKRLYDVIDKEEPRGQSVSYQGIPCTARHCCTVLNRLTEENEQLHHELQQTKEYLQTKIDECKNHKKMKEIVFGVEQAVGYEKALLQFQKGLKRRLNDECKTICDE